MYLFRNSTNIYAKQARKEEYLLLSIFTRRENSRRKFLGFSYENSSVFSVLNDSPSQDLQ